MRRTQIELTDEQARQLEELAATAGRSVDDVIRESLDIYIGKVTRNDRAATKQRALKAIGRFRSSVTDLGSKHDEYLAEDLKA